MKKKFFAIVLCLVLCVSMFPITALAEEGEPCEHQIVAVPEGKTCGSPFRAHYRCTVCGALFEDKDGNTPTTRDALRIAALNHDKVALVHKDQISATCSAAGTKEHWSCPTCGQKFAENNRSKPVTDQALVIPALPHTIDPASWQAPVAHTCTQDGTVGYYTCSGCGQRFADLDGETLLTDINDPARHQLTEHPAVDATCTTDGNSKYYSCDICGLFFDENKNETAQDSWVIRSGHQYVGHEAEEATPEEDGNDFYYSCSGCDKLFDVEYHETTWDEIKIEKQAPLTLMRGEINRDTAIGEATPISVTINYNKESVNIGDQITATYSITGGSGNYPTIFYGWKEYSGGAWLISDNLPLNSSQGTLSYSPRLGSKVHLYIFGEDTEMRSFSETGSDITVSDAANVEPISVSITYNKSSLILGEEITATYSITGGSGNYSSISYYWSEYSQGSWTNPGFTNMTTKEGTLRYTPVSGAKVQIYFYVVDSDNRHQPAYGDEVPVLMSGSNKYITVNNGYASINGIEVNQASSGTVIDISSIYQEGKVFYRWEGSEGVIFTDALSETTSFTMPDNNVIITAVKKCYVSFDMHGHGETPETQYVVPGEKATEPTRPTTEGYRFDGWYSDATCTTRFDFSNTFINNNTTVHAKWVKTWTVTTSTMHGKVPGTNLIIKTEIVDDGKKVSEPEALAWIGYKWGGWYSGTTEFNYNTPIHNDTSIYANWIPDFRITDGNGGTAHYGNGYAFTLNYYYPDYVVFKDLFKIYVARQESAYRLVDSSNYVVAEAQNNDSRVVVTLKTSFIRTLSEGLTYNIRFETGTADPPLDLGSTDGNFKVSEAPLSITVNNCVAKVNGEVVQSAAKDTKVTVNATVPEGKTFHSWTVSEGVVLEDSTASSTSFVMPNRAVTLTANVKNKVTFYENGVTGVSDWPEDQYLENGAKVTKPSKDPKATGYHFLGWFTAANGNTAFDFEGTQISSNTTVYAHWVRTWNVSFDKNGATTVSNWPENQTVDNNKKAVRPSPDPTTEGRTFIDWYNEPGCTTLFDFSKPITKNTPVYACWGYQVSFSTNHGSAPVSQAVKAGGTATKPAAPTADGYKFEGWYLEKDYSGKEYFEQPVAINKNITLYAKWTSDLRIESGDKGTAHYGSVYTFRLNCNYAEVQGKLTISVDNQAVDQKYYELSSGSTIVKLKEEYVDSLTEGEHSIVFNTNIADLGQVPGKFTVTKAVATEYNIIVNGCTAIIGSTVVTKAPAGTTVTVTAAVPGNKTFYSWTTSKELVLSDTNPEVFEMPANSVSITANLGGTVTFSNNGKTDAKDMPANQLVKAGDKVAKPKEDEKPTLDGYRFLGWYTTSEGTTEFDFDKTTIFQNTTIYAHWIKTHTVKFETKHGIAPEKQVIDDGKKATKPTDPQMTGYKFVGWYTDSTLRSAYNWETPVKEDKTLYAKWTGELKITDGNGGTAHYGSDYSFTLNCDFDEVYIPFELKIDSKVINYEQYELKAVKGGTEVVLKKALVRSLAAGNHTIDFITGVEDLGSVHGTFKVSTSPKTGDESNVVLWGAVAAVSLIAVAAILFFLRKKKKKK